MHAYPAEGPTGHDDNAFIAMCEQHRARLVAYCKRRLGTVHDAEDAAHEALVRALQAMPGFDHSSDAWPWLRTIAGRVCTDMQRRAARAPAPGLVEVPVADDVHDQVADRLRADILDDALDRLSPRYRSAIVLREFGGWSYDEIARAQGRSIPSVRSILTRGRKRLGSHVESVARSRGQWPLPGGVPPVRRLREQLRTWREAVERGPALLSAVELSSLASRWMVAAQATVAAGALSLSPAIAPGVVPAAARPIAAPAPLAAVAVTPQPQPQVAVTRVAATPVAGTTAAARASATSRETLADVEAVTAISDEHAPGVRAGGGAGIDGNGDTVWVRDYHRVTLPIIGPVGSSGETNIPCTRGVARTVACTVLRAVAPHLPS